MRGTQTISDGLRYYVGIPWTRPVDAVDQDAVATALEAPVIEHAGQSDDVVNTRDVAVTDAYVFVEYELGRDAGLMPSDAAAAVSQTVGEWLGEHAPLAPARGDRVSGLLTSPPLEAPRGRETVLKRLEALHAGEDDPGGGEGRHYAIAVPERPLTDGEVQYVRRSADQPVAVANGYVVLLDACPPYQSYRWRGSNDLRRLRRRLGPLAETTEDTDPSAQEFWQTRHHGTLGGVVEDVAREAVTEYATQQSPHTGSTDAARPTETADS
jgi:hypothetical protein